MEGFLLASVAAFFGGAVSFLSPCVLPLVPGYICFAAGIGFDNLTQAHLRPAIMRAALAFVGGFSVIFIAAGAGAASLNPLILAQKPLLSQIAGGVIIFLGAYVAGFFRFERLVALLGRERRFNAPVLHIARTPLHQLIAAFIMGMAFAFGWTPCIGPILAGILTLAAGRESLGEGVSLLAIYAAGLGVPFLLAAMATSYFLTFSTKIKKHLKWIERGAGILLIITGFAIMSGTLQTSASYLLDWFPWLQNFG